MRLRSGVFSLLENFTFDLFLYDCVNVRMLYKYVKKTSFDSIGVKFGRKMQFFFTKAMRL